MCKTIFIQSPVEKTSFAACKIPADQRGLHFYEIITKLQPQWDQRLMEFPVPFFPVTSLGFQDPLLTRPINHGRGRKSEQGEAQGQQVCPEKHYRHEILSGMKEFHRSQEKHHLQRRDEEGRCQGNSFPGASVE